MNNYPAAHGAHAILGETSVVFDRVTRTLHAHRTREIEYDKVTGMAVRFPGRLGNGHLQLYVFGEQPDPKPEDDPNALTFSGTAASELAELVYELERRIRSVPGSRLGAVVLRERAADYLYHDSSGDPDREAFEGVAIRDGRVISLYGGGPLRGAVAEVRAADELRSGVDPAMGRLLGAAWDRAVSGQGAKRDLFLLVGAVGWGVLVPFPPRRVNHVQALAKKITEAGAAAKPQSAKPQSAKPQSAGGAKAAELQGAEGATDSASAQEAAAGGQKVAEGAVAAVGAAGTVGAAGVSRQHEAGGDVIDQIRRLSLLHKDDILTSDEFAAKKADLLTRI